MPEQTGFVMAFDFGTKRIGVAIGQTVTATASPLTILSAKDGIPCWSSLDTLIAHWHPVQFVVGLPLNMDGSTQWITHCAKKFGHRLTARYQKLCHFVDERLTTEAAKTRINAPGRAKKKQPAIDAVSAQIILETWLAGTLQTE